MSLTPSSPGSPELPSGEVHSWCVHLDVSPDAYRRLQAGLADDERSRSERLRFEGDRRRFVVAHAVLRDLLARYLGETRPSRIRYEYNAFGKPALSPECASRLKFNLSHSAECAIIALVADADIGVDIEHIRPLPGHAEIARRFFSAAEVGRLTRLPSHLQAEAFFSCWTRKEAYMKALGAGLDMLDGLVGDAASAPRWSLFTLRPAPGYVGALVVGGTGWRLRQWDYFTDLSAAAADSACRTS